jgi:hypothetical protein
MPFTPYHFGPSAFLGLVFRKWLDIPVFVLANVIVDVEVLVIYLFQLGYPHHRYCHTFLIGAAVGLLWGASAYLLRHIFKRLMQILHIPYQTGLLRMLISGILGVWLHVFIDGLYHFDTHIFWPSKTIWLWRTIHHHLDVEQIQTICLFFFLAAVVPYLLAVRSFSSAAASDSKDKIIKDTGGPE